MSSGEERQDYYLVVCADCGLSFGGGSSINGIVVNGRLVSFWCKECRQDQRTIRPRFVPEIIHERVHAAIPFPQGKVNVRPKFRVTCSCSGDFNCRVCKGEGHYMRTDNSDLEGGIPGRT